MQLTKIFAVLLGSIVMLTPFYGVAATQKATAEAVKSNQSKKAAPKKASAGKRSASTVKQPKNKPKKTQKKKAEAKKSNIKGKKANTKTNQTKKQRIHSTHAKKGSTNPKAKTKNTTKQLYGVKGVALKPTKVSNRRYSYREKGKTYTSSNKETSRLYSQTGVASYYGGMFHGRKTASGELFNKNAYTAAHKTLALGSYALVTNLRNGRRVIVKINDRGPFSKSRIIDLSVAAAREIGMIHSGVARVKVEAMQVDRNGYITGKAAHTLYAIAKRTHLPLKVKGQGNDFAIKAE